MTALPVVHMVVDPKPEPAFFPALPPMLDVEDIYTLGSSSMSMSGMVHMRPRGDQSHHFLFKLGEACAKSKLPKDRYPEMRGFYRHIVPITGRSRGEDSSVERIFLKFRDLEDADKFMEHWPGKKTLTTLYDVSRVAHDPRQIITYVSGMSRLKPAPRLQHLVEYMNLPYDRKDETPDPRWLLEFAKPEDAVTFRMYWEEYKSEG